MGISFYPEEEQVVASLLKKPFLLNCCSVTLQASYIVGT